MLELPDALAHHRSMVEQKLSLAMRVKLARKTRGWGVNELERRMGIDSKGKKGSGYITRIESGKTKRPGADKMAKMAEVFECSLSWLISGEGEPGMELLDVSSLEESMDPKTANRELLKVQAKGREGIDQRDLDALDKVMVTEEDVGDLAWWRERLWHVRSERLVLEEELKREAKDVFHAKQPGPPIIQRKKTAGQ